MELLALLRVQRELLDEPRGFARFAKYVQTMVGEDGDLRLPLAGFNPMSKAHVADVLDRLLALDAEAVAVAAIAESVARLRGVQGLPGLPRYRCGLVVADDAAGGWTDRVLFEAKERFENRYAARHGLFAVTWWSSEVPGADRVRSQTAAAIYRAAWIAKHGQAKTLADMMRQEGMAARFARTEEEPVAAEVVERVRGRLQSRHYPEQIACLYGDAAARSLGYDGVGVSEWGGLRFAASRQFLGDEDAVEALA